MDLETRIEDLLEKNDIEDNNLIIVEDKEDTKKATVEELKKAFVGDILHTIGFNTSWYKE